MSGHDKIHVQYMDTEAEIDRPIAGLIEAIWQADLMTVMSCQDAPHGWVWIQFATEVHAAAFLSILAAYDSEAENLCDRMHPNQDHADGNFPDGMWQYAFYPRSFPIPQMNAADGVADELPGKPSYVTLILTSVRFPPRDLLEVERRLRMHNQAVDGKGGAALQIDDWVLALRTLLESQPDRYPGNLTSG